MISAEEKTHRRNVAIISLVPASSPLWKLLKRIKMHPFISE